MYLFWNWKAARADKGGAPAESFPTVINSKQTLNLSSVRRLPKKFQKELKL